ncbi:hypothetical protein AMAG_04543 [Allomyces macrogynus ATCC 38327]|uniref:DNA-directed RNA polymerase subunit n=1 Tax=Allomyces macrogynus (strain ATCC 38327) TaxID=578462 RepID=A0A0L0S567_ALLM3|nr:hypothetical protein AMAG_04543 [Allomyces macrogynus ATCC 38327]|eukprot:KNE57683.1 hypothetical protein AMAG_04543 [Allomyces macrogynus ATCC 38327]
MADGSARVRFCSDCNNLLYPREDRVENRLLYACRRCGTQEEALDACVYRHEIAIQERGETGRLRDLIKDPTLPKASKRCPQCGNGSAVYFQSRANHKDATMTLFYVCNNEACMHQWSSDQDQEDMDDMA